MNDDLWPADLLSEIPRTPKHILLEQATALGVRCNNIIRARVRTNVDEAGDFIHSFEVFSQALKGYRYSLFSIWHGPTLYPVQVVDDPGGVRYGNEAAFRTWLQSALSSPHIVGIIRAIVAQIRAEDSPTGISPPDSEELPF